MRKLSEIYTKLSEAFIIFRSSTLCVDIQWLINAQKITKEEYNLLINDFAQFQPKDAKKGDEWFANREERLEFLRKRIHDLKIDGL